MDDRVFEQLFDDLRSGIDASAPPPNAELARVLATGLGRPSPSRRSIVPTTRRSRLAVGAVVGLATLTGAGAAGALPAPAEDAIEAVTPFSFGERVKADATGESDGEHGVDGAEISDEARQRAPQSESDVDDVVAEPEAAVEDEAHEPQGRAVGPPEDHTTGPPADRPVGPPEDRWNGPSEDHEPRGRAVGPPADHTPGPPADHPVGPPADRGPANGD